MSDSNGLRNLPLIEQAQLGSGADMCHSKERGPVRAVTMVDGPHGVRKPVSDSIAASTSPATCFPPAVGLAQTWDTALAERIGAALGAECNALGVHVLLGPGLNIKRDPRCGRNFEYFSEDPLLTGSLGAAWVTGLQSRGVGASLKHFAANNAETDRMRSSSDVDDRTLREIYLRAFQRVVQQAKPWTVMCAYNRINGVYASESKWLLTDVLREEWRFDGVVVSDWGAVSDRAAALAAGLDLEMPGPADVSDAAVVAAVQAGSLSEADVARAAGRIAQLSAKAHAGAGTPMQVDHDAHHALAREAAGRAIVLLKNDDQVLPLTSGSIAVTGEFAQHPVFQGGGSSHVVPTRVDVPIDQIRALAGDRRVTYTRGFDSASDAGQAELREEAVRRAAQADTAVVFLGLPPSAESEGWDRDDIDLPSVQLELLKAVAAVQPRTVAVLSHGGVVASGTVAEYASAVIDGALLGQAGGGAIADVLFGRVNPSGRLAETVPRQLTDLPSYLNFPPEAGHVAYGERIFVGYRGYDALGRDVAFPFGHGLSYTRFDYTGSSIQLGDNGIRVEVTVTNTGSRRGREVVQVYAGKPDSAVSRPPRWLVGFGDIELDPGESGICEILVDVDELAYWDVRLAQRVVEAGDYVLSVGASSRDIRLTGSVAVLGDTPRVPLTIDSTLAEVLADPTVGPMFAHFADVDHLPSEALGTDVMGLVGQIPIGRLVALSGGQLTREQLQDMLDAEQAG